MQRDRNEKKLIAGLRWIAAREPVGWFDITAPSTMLRRRMERDKLIEECGREPGMFGVLKFRLTDAGRALLAQHPGDNMKGAGRD